jgi:hypothetical protein
LSVLSVKLTMLYPLSAAIISGSTGRGVRFREAFEQVPQPDTLALRLMSMYVVCVGRGLTRKVDPLDLTSG